MLEQLQIECAKKKKHRSMSTIQDLTIQLYSYRRKWIQESTPLTVDIKKQYPSLKLRKVVCIFRCLCFILLLSTCIPSLYVQFRTEFKTIVGLPDDVGVFSLMESWPTWKERIIKYSSLEKTHRPKLKKLLVSLEDAAPPASDDTVTTIILSVAEGIFGI